MAKKHPSDRYPYIEYLNFNDESQKIILNEGPLIYRYIDVIDPKLPIHYVYEKHFAEDLEDTDYTEFEEYVEWLNDNCPSWYFLLDNDMHEDIIKAKYKKRQKLILGKDFREYFCGDSIAIAFYEKEDYIKAMLRG